MIIVIFKKLDISNTNFFRRTICLLILLSYSSIGVFAQSSDTEFNHDGVSFSCPTGWKITEQASIDDVGYDLTVEKQGFDESGIMTLAWFNQFVDPNQWFNSVKRQFTEEEVFKNAALDFTKPQKVKFAGINGIEITYVMSLLGVKHRGSLLALNKNEKSVFINRQEALEDIDKNVVGFKKIEESLKIN